MPPQAPFAQLAEARFRPRFQETELGVAQAHFHTDPFLGLAHEVEPREDVAVPPAQFLENAQHDFRPLPRDRILLRIAAASEIVRPDSRPACSLRVCTALSM